MNDFNNEQEGTEQEGAPTSPRPLGFWLKVVDGLLTREFAAAFADEGVTRREWMLLNAVSGDVDVPGVAERLARKGKRLRGLEERGWVDQTGDGTWVLTAEGRAAHERLGAVVDGIRSRVSGAVSPEEFATTMASLEAIARELGWDENERMPRPGRRGGRGRGFGRGRGRGFDAGFDGGFGYGPRGFDRGYGYGPRGFGRERGFGYDRGLGHRFDPRVDSGHPCHRGGHHGHAHHRHGDHAAERAYERGFDAGYARGQDSAPA